MPRWKKDFDETCPCDTCQRRRKVWNEEVAYERREQTTWHRLSAGELRALRAVARQRDEDRQAMNRS
jgi:hypothetical protein